MACCFSRVSTTPKRVCSAKTLSLLALLAGCAGKDAGPQQPISENLAPAVASPATEAFVPMGTSNSGYYSDAMDPFNTGSTAPMREPSTPTVASQEATEKQGVRETRHTFTPKVNRTTPVQMTPLPGATNETPTVVTGLTDGQIVRIAETMQSTELAEASIVAERAQSAQVKDFSSRLKADNKQLKENTQQVAKTTGLTPSESSVSADLRVKASQELTSVELASPEEFDQAFIEAQVKENEERLQLLNARLIPSAEDPKLKAELTKSRAVLERQLDEARNIQRALETGTAR